jgi:MoaA/NifB/PqqE/SkfB family radical SAM enzyme
MIGHAIRLLYSVARNRRGWTSLPRLLTYTITFRCNARCRMCDSWRIESQDELATWELERICRQLPRMAAVRLTGGEPFVRPDLPEIARVLEERLQPVALCISTNGFLTQRIVDYCERRERRVPLRLIVSLDGSEQKHNEVRGNRHAWSSAIETVRSLANRQRHLRLTLGVNQTIVDEEGFDQYRQLRAILSEFDVVFSSVIAYQASAMYRVDREPAILPQEPGAFAAFGHLSPDGLRAWLELAEEDLNRMPLLDRLARRYYLRGIGNRLLSGRAAPQPPCVALNSHLRLLPNGDVPTCQFNGRIIGNLRRDKFTNLWHCATAADQRAWVRRCAGCWAECETLPSGVYSGDLIRALRGNRSKTRLPI